jgi:large subunit ribosomal protein L14
MIQQQTLLKVIDNSGAKTVKCIKVLGGFKRKYAKIGDCIIVSIQSLRNKFKETSKVKKREVYKALIIKSKKVFRKKNYEFTKFEENSVILINKQNAPIGTRILEQIPYHLKKKKFQKFISISSGLI